MEVKQREKKLLAGADNSFPVEIERAHDCYIYDSDGNRYMDFMSSWCVGNLGWSNFAAADAVRNYDGPPYASPKVIYKPVYELAELLAEITPGKLHTTFRATGGSEAVDAALQIAMAYTGRKGILSLRGSYHGNCISNVSVGDKEAAEKIHNKLENIGRIKIPLNKERLKTLESRLKTKEYAAFIMEPIALSIGVHIPDVEFMQEAQGMCKKYGTLFIADEVATGFGRTGKMFACSHFDLEPDIMCLAKGITGGYAPMGATITTEKIAKKVKDDVNIYSTYGWHPLSVHVALANINYMIEHDEILVNVNELADLFDSYLNSIPFRDDFDVRVKGLAIAVELRDDKYADKIRKKCLDKGLLIEAQGETLVMFPPLNITEDQALDGLDILKSCC